MKPNEPDDRGIRELSRSPHLLAVADSVLKNVDREALAELLAAYLYLSSKGEVELGDVLRYAASRRPLVWAAVGASAAPAILAGILTDKGFRSAVFSSVGSWIRGSAAKGNAEPTA